MGVARILVALVILGVSGWLAFRLIGLADQNGPNSDTRIRTDASAAPRRKPLPTPLDAGPTRRVETVIPRAHPLTDALCPIGMAWISGEYCPPGGVGAHGCKVSTREMAFCMDEHEYPNQIGVFPAVMLLFAEASKLCEAADRRLCSASEWTHACRQTISTARCNVGRVTKEVPQARLLPRGQVSAYVSDQDGRRRSAVSTCVSPGGIFDLLGNVQEWVQSEHPSGYQAALKGGSFAQREIGCERTVQSRQVYSRLPNTGLRCCRDPLVRVPGGR